MCITPLLPIAHRAGERVTWLSSQWKLSAYLAHFCVEINTETKHLINGGGIATMKSSAILVNAARGGRS
jgi:phosphoglycerate dehydrogenase-like enzyme